MPSRYPRRFPILLALALCPAAGVLALQPSAPLAQMSRQSWNHENGLPQNGVSVLLQSREGYLWAGAELGLARFDGVYFRIFDHATSPLIPDAEVRCLLDTGDLWQGTGDGLVHWVDGSPALLTTRDGLPSNSIRGLAQTTDGKLWVWTESGLALWSDGKFEPIHPAIPDAPPIPGDAITSIAAGSGGDLWIGSRSGVAQLHRGSWRLNPEGEPAKFSKSHPAPARDSLVFPAGGGDLFVSSPSGIFLAHAGAIALVAAPNLLPADPISFLARLANGTIAAASKSALILFPNPTIKSPAARFTVAQQLPGTRIEAIYADREGDLWVGVNHGLARISGDGAAIETLPPADPLSAASVVSFLEDREGDLWVGTETAGLHILRDAPFRAMGAADGLASDNTTAIVEDRRGALWIGTRNDGLNRISPSQIATLTTKDGLLSNVILALAAAPSGDLWIGTPDGLNRLRPQLGAAGVTAYTSADGLPDDFIRSLLIAPDGSLWIATRRGLTHFTHGVFQTFTRADGLGSDLVGALASTPDGDLWIATLDGLSRLHQGRLRNYTTADGLSSNVITALDVAPDGKLWIGTQADGLNLWDGDRFASFHGGPPSQQPLPQSIHAILHDGQGQLWLASDSGLTRAGLSALSACAGRQVCQLPVQHFTTADGLRSRETSSNSHPTACRRATGELWFTTPRGVILVDPHQIPATPPPPPTLIERFAVDNREMQPSQLARISAGHLSFQFDYAGLSFAAPQKVRYQYILQGFDHAWTDAGTRRTAYYTNIPPGKYRFLVRASLGDTPLPPATGGNSSSQASLSFELQPHSYQTWWFRTLAVLLVAALIVWASRRRVLRVEREFRAVMGERNRIAREIHDTLAQGYVGISLQLEILGELLRHNRADAATKHLALTQQLVREGLDDARQSIWALRSQDAAEQTLPIRLRRLADQAQDPQLAAEFQVHGAYRALPAEVEKETLRIAQEAIQNVKRHASATRLSIHLDYGQRALALTIADNGIGFSPGLPPSASDNGHFGLTGMRERAALIHAHLEVVSQPGQGATIQLNIPVPEAATREQSPLSRSTENASPESKLQE